MPQAQRCAFSAPRIVQVRNSRKARVSRNMGSRIGENRDRISTAFARGKAESRHESAVRVRDANRAQSARGRKLPAGRRNGPRHFINPPHRSPLPHLPSPTVATMTSTSVATVELEDNNDAQRVGKFMCVVPPKVRSTRAIENLSRQLSAAPHLRLERRATRGPSRANYATGNDFRAHLFHLRHASPPRRLQHRRSA